MKRRTLTFSLNSLILGIVMIPYHEKMKATVFHAIAFCVLGVAVLVPTFIFGELRITWEIATQGAIGLVMIAFVIVAGFMVSGFKTHEWKRAFVALGLTVVFAVAAIGLIFYVLPSTHGVGGVTDSFGHDQASAKVILQEAVRDRLDAPASAVFSDWDDTDVTLYNDMWTARGWVESLNEYGNMIRKDYMITLEFTGEDDYTVKNCIIG